jgi:hypothetical protein
MPLLFPRRFIPGGNFPSQPSIFVVRLSIFQLNHQKFNRAFKRASFPSTPRCGKQASWKKYQNFTTAVKLE